MYQNFFRSAKSSKWVRGVFTMCGISYMLRLTPVKTQIGRLWSSLIELLQAEPISCQEGVLGSVVSYQ